MEGFDLHSLFSQENITQWVNTYKGWGWWPGLALTFVESLVSVLPLVVIIIANAAAYGIWKGYLISELGSVLGALAVYFVAKKYGDRLGDWIKRKFPKSKKMFKKLEKKGFFPIFLFSSLPFSPSALVNLAAGITNTPFWTFFLAVTLGKGLLIGVFSFIGSNVQSWLEQPWKLALVGLGVLAVWFFGRKIANKEDGEQS